MLFVAVFFDHAIGLIKAQFARLGEVVDALFGLLGEDFSQTTVVPGLGEITFEGDGTGIVVDGPLIVATLGIEVATIIIEEGIVRQELEGIGEIAHDIGCLKITSMC